MKPPLASSFARPPTCATAARSCSGVMLSSRIQRRARRERLVDLVERAAFDLEREPGARAARRAYRLAHPAGQRGVVLLDQDRVVQTRAVVGAASGGDRGLLERPQPRASSCACRGSALRSPRSPSRIAPSASRPRTAGEEVERGPLGRSAAPAPSPRRASPGRRRATRPRLRAAQTRLRVERSEHLLGRRRARRSRPAPSG